MHQIELTPKQRRFVDEYLLDLNATQAAVRAGYKPDHARQMGAENLSKPVIADAIAATQRVRNERLQLTQDAVLRGLLREATWVGDGSSHSARVAAWGLIARHLGMLERRPQFGEIDQVFTIAITHGPSPELPRQTSEEDQTALTINHRPDWEQT